MSSRKNHLSTDGILLMLCNSVVKVLTSAMDTEVAFSPMIQKINRTCLKPDIACFVLFEGGFSGLVVSNFSAAAALEIYQTYLLRMGIPEAELATQHTSDEVGNVMGELMNQIIGDFTSRVGEELLTSISQNQPKMLVINKEVMVSINTNLDRPQTRRVTFKTARNNIFYLEFAVDRTEFVQLQDFTRQDEINPDKIIAETESSRESTPQRAVLNQDLEQLNSELLEKLGF
ncbi:MAG: DUF3334 family protein [Gammaproteobacteria bacterium]|nr:DUF3334 family protein [Gammaproteobacteria bacterium]MCP5418307.1 DUF3334 family protein [Chromatiaceae bacterium]